MYNTKFIVQSQLWELVISKTCDMQPVPRIDVPPPLQKNPVLITAISACVSVVHELDCIAIDCEMLVVHLSERVALAS